MIKVNDEIVKIERFPDGTPKINIDPAMIEEKEYNHSYWITIDWLYENDEELFYLFLVKKHIEKLFVNTHYALNLPYIPNARMDRVKNQDEVFTLKYFCDFINSLNFDIVWVLDPHSYVSEALINNIEVSQPDGYILTAIKSMCSNYPDITKEDWMLFYPDEGAMKRYSTNLPYKYAFGIKKRDWSTGKIEGLDVAGCTDEIKDKIILIVDDICSRGGTFYHGAKKLKELGAKAVYLYITHCENTILEGELLTSGLIEKVYTTNSIFTKEHEKIEVFEL